MVAAVAAACCGQSSVTGGMPQPWNQVCMVGAWQVRVMGGMPQPWNQVPIACAAAPTGGLVTVVQPGRFCVCATQVCHAVCPMVCGFCCVSLSGQKGACVAQAMLVAQMALTGGSTAALVSGAGAQVAVAAGSVSAGLAV
jgi:hypothetical protein